MNIHGVTACRSLPQGLHLDPYTRLSHQKWQRGRMYRPAQEPEEILVLKESGFCPEERPN